MGVKALSDQVVLALSVSITQCPENSHGDPKKTSRSSMWSRRHFPPHRADIRPPSNTKQDLLPTVLERLLIQARRAPYGAKQLIQMSRAGRQSSPGWAGAPATVDGPPSPSAPEERGGQLMSPDHAIPLHLKRLLCAPERPRFLVPTGLSAPAATPVGPALSSLSLNGFQMDVQARGAEARGEGTSLASVHVPCHLGLTMLLPQAQTQAKESPPFRMA